MQKSHPKKPIFKEQSQSLPGLESRMDPLPEFEDHSPGSDKLLGKKCIITGGDSGIGRAVAVAFAKQGADVAILYHPKEKEDADFMVNYIRQNFKRQCLSIAADISKEENCKTAIGQIVKTFEKVDVLVNNAGVQYPAADITQISSEKLMETFSINIFAMFWITSAVVPYMPKGGCIINTTSVTAYRGSAGLIDYSATKGAIVSFTRSLSTNLMEKGIRVNGVAPGPVWTPLITATFPPEEVAKFGTDSPMKRPAQPREVAPAYVFLASEDASFISGQIIHVNGGEIVNG
ncbi:MAG TPA: NAD(P)-dependent oxidoreductase [Prolixibacteraceae bacterium]|jgi:NAD(P)-dependent dehydrogenase (short-subunit alcohol dehydrogenase family)|nr:NAD(P)-dependent oxidoreductase [Prolixibacteraceae bacterium]